MQLRLLFLNSHRYREVGMLALACTAIWSSFDWAGVLAQASFRRKRCLR